MDFEYLSDRPEDVPLIIQWWHTVWGDRMGPDMDKLVQVLASSLSKTELPIHILATSDGNPIGTAALKLHEQADLFPDFQYWLGSVFVASPNRGGGVASALTMQVVELALQMKLPHLYLQTADLSGGLYAQLGWEPIRVFEHKQQQALLMLKKLSNTQAD